MRTLLIIVAVIVGVMILGLLYLELRTILAEHGSEQQLFSTGQLPAPLPDGFYQGNVRLPSLGWVGKTFDLATKTGVNNFGDGTQKYAFKFYPGTGLKDNEPVLKIDYNLAANPWWLRFVTDELVQTAPNHYLGKIQVHGLGLVFTLGYFTLTK